MKRLCAKSELPAEGKAKEFPVEGRMVCVANVAGVYSALDNVCPHRGGQLGLGVVLDGKLICPWHGWSFEPQSGRITHLPQEKVATYRLEIEGEDVLIEM